MIDPRELRIGNILKGENGPVIVCALSDYGRVAVKYPKYAPLFAQEAKEMTIEPIPLTEDILLKCGFSKSNFYEGKYDYENGSCLSFMFKNGIVYEDIDLCSCSRDFSFLHELQNYVFAKTGKELEVKI